MNNIKISVIVPLYNNEKYMRRCLDSLLSQTLKDIEIIVVDDASTDRTWQYLNLYYVAIKNIRRIRHRVNKGTGEARNTGLRIAQGEFVTFVDHDDYVEPTYLEIMYNNAKDYNADVSACGVRVFWLDNKASVYTSYKADLEGHNEIFKNIINSSIDTATWGKIVSRKLIEKYNIQYPNCVMEDIIFWIHVFCYTKHYVSVPNLLYNWCINEKSQTLGVGKESDSIDNFCEIFDRAQKILQNVKNNGVFLSDSEECAIYNYLIISSVYTLHKYMSDNEWENFKSLLYERIKDKFGMSAEYIFAILSMYRNLYISNKGNK